MPFRSTRQRTWMKINKPEMYAKWRAEHETKIRKTGGRKRTHKSK